MPNGRHGQSALYSGHQVAVDGNVPVSPLLKFGSLGLAALLFVSAVAVTLVEGEGILHGLWLVANTIFTTGFGSGPQTQAGQMIVVGTMLVMVPLWVVTLVGVIETAAWRVEQRRLTGSPLAEIVPRIPSSDPRPSENRPPRVHENSVIIRWWERRTRRLVNCPGSKKHPSRELVSVLISPPKTEIGSVSSITGPDERSCSSARRTIRMRLW